MYKIICASRQYELKDVNSICHLMGLFDYYADVYLYHDNRLIAHGKNLYQMMRCMNG